MSTNPNIWSGADDPLLAALTNPTGLSRRKGRIKYDYPVKIGGKLYPDAEAAYKAGKTGDLAKDRAWMTKVIRAKLEQHPQLMVEIQKRGGDEFLAQTIHYTGRKDRWTSTTPGESQFIQALRDAYRQASGGGTSPSPKSVVPGPPKKRLSTIAPPVYGSEPDELRKAKRVTNNPMEGQELPDPQGPDLRPPTEQGTRKSTVRLDEVAKREVAESVVPSRPPFGKARGIPGPLFGAATLNPAVPGIASLGSRGQEGHLPVPTPVSGPPPVEDLTGRPLGDKVPNVGPEHPYVGRQRALIEAADAVSVGGRSVNGTWRSGDVEDIRFDDPTSVLNRREGWSPDAVDIMRQSGRGMHYGNPFSHLPPKKRAKGTIGVKTAEDAVEAYEEWLDGDPKWAHVEPKRRDWINQRIREGALSGKDLMCCCHPKPCHGHVLMRRASGHGMTGMRVMRAERLKELVPELGDDIDELVKAATGKASGKQLIDIGFAVHDPVLGPQGRSAKMLDQAASRGFSIVRQKGQKPMLVMHLTTRPRTFWELTPEAQSRFIREARIRTKVDGRWVDMAPDKRAALVDKLRAGGRKLSAGQNRLVERAFQQNWDLVVKGMPHTAYMGVLDPLQFVMAREMAWKLVNHDGVPWEHGEKVTGIKRPPGARFDGYSGMLVLEKETEKRMGQALRRYWTPNGAEVLYLDDLPFQVGDWRPLLHAGMSQTAKAKFGGLGMEAIGAAHNAILKDPVISRLRPAEGLSSVHWAMRVFQFDAANVVGSPAKGPYDYMRRLALRLNPYQVRDIADRIQGNRLGEELVGRLNRRLPKRGGKTSELFDPPNPPKYPSPQGVFITEGQPWIRRTETFRAPDPNDVFTLRAMAEPYVPQAEVVRKAPMLTGTDPRPGIEAPKARMKWYPTPTQLGVTVIDEPEGTPRHQVAREYTAERRREKLKTRLRGLTDTVPTPQSKPGQMEFPFKGSGFRSGTGAVPKGGRLRPLFEMPGQLPLRTTPRPITGAQMEFADEVPNVLRMLGTEATVGAKAVPWRAPRGGSLPGMALNLLLGGLAGMK